MGGKAGTLAERFVTKFVVGAAGECWEWTAHRERRGYGKILDERRRCMRAHRVSWMVHRGPIPDGIHVLHRCDNPPCVNPDHLFLGTHDDNMSDKVAKGRQARTGGGLGERCGSHKLTADQIPVIRQMRASGVTLLAIAARFGMSQGAVHAVVHGRTWKHVREVAT